MCGISMFAYIFRHVIFIKKVFFYKKVFYEEIRNKFLFLLLKSDIKKNI